MYGKGFGDETQAMRVWNLMSGTYDFNKYRPPEADIVKCDWEDDPNCARLWERIWDMCDEFMSEEDAEECRNCIYDLTEAFAIKMFEYRQILKDTPLELDQIVYDLIVQRNAPKVYGWDDGGTVKVIFENPEVEKSMDHFCAAWEHLEKRLNVEGPENDPDVLVMFEEHKKLLEIFSRQMFRYGQILRM